MFFYEILQRDLEDETGFNVQLLTGHPKVIKFEFFPRIKNPRTHHDVLKDSVATIYLPKKQQGVLIGASFNTTLEEYKQDLREELPQLFL